MLDWLRVRLRSVPGVSVVVAGVLRPLTYSHCAIVDANTIELGCSVMSARGLLENNRGNALALAIWSVSEEDLLDRSDGFGKVFLYGGQRG